MRLAFLLTGHAGVAEEVVQDAFVATHRIGDRPAGPVPLRPTCRREPLPIVGTQVHRRTSAPPRLTDLAELAADEMWDALAALTDRQRIAIVLRFYEDMPDDRIVEILDCRQATVRSAIHRGLQSLRQVIVL